MIDELLPEARRIYTYFSNLLGIDIFSERTILRALNNPAQLNKWHASTSRPGYEPYIGYELKVSSYGPTVSAPLRYGQIRQAYQVEISSLITHYRSYLKEKQLLIEGLFDFSKMEIAAEGVYYDAKSYDRIVFCEGWQALRNPYFQKLPFQPAKGEALFIEIDQLDTHDILRDDIFIVPLANGLCWSGGSYIWSFEDHLPTEEWKEEWTGKLDQLLQTGYTIKAHKAGIRPSVKGRRPLIGPHKDYPRLYIFNGLGTKGTSLAPFWARHLVEAHLLGGKDIHADVSIARFDY